MPQVIQQQQPQPAIEDPPQSPGQLDSSSSSSCNDSNQTGPRVRTRTIMTPFQARILKRVLETTAFPTSDLRDNLARILGMKPRTIQIWFQNQRQKTRQRQRSRDQQQQPASETLAPPPPAADLKWSRFHGAFHNLSPGLHPACVQLTNLAPIACLQSTPSGVSSPASSIPGYRFRYHNYQPPAGGVRSQSGTPLSSQRHQHPHQQQQQQQQPMPTVTRMPMLSEQMTLSGGIHAQPMVPQRAPLSRSFSPVKRPISSQLEALCEAAAEADHLDGAITLLSAVDTRHLDKASLRPW